jgi:acyl-CoA synthetase (AMP-forming)/AMP-acid ligase II
VDARAIPFILLTQPPVDTEQRVLRHLTSIFAAGAGSRSREIFERWGPIFIDGFGMSETPGTLTGPDSFDHDEPFPCVGRAVPGIDLRIADLETGETCAPRQHGEIVVRYGLGFAGYFGNPAAFAEAVRNGWFHTGDIAYADETGRVFFVDRIKDIIRRGGENLSAREIEQVLGAHPEVAEAFAVAKPDRVLGETVCAYLVPKQPGRAFSLEEIRTFCEGRLAPIKLPEDVRTVAGDTLPRTPTGRVQKFRLKKALREEAGA